MAWLDVALIEQLGMTLMHFLWQGLLIGALYWLTLIIVRPASAKARYNLAVATLMTLGSTPILTFLYLGSAGAGAATGLASESTAVMQLVVSASEPIKASSLLAWTVAGWLAGVLMLSVRLILGWHYIIKLRRSARRQALAHLSPLLDQLRHSMAIQKSVVLAVSDRVRSPVVVGWLKPLILFPPALISRLSPAQVEMILAHELAHIRRHDHLINLVQTVIETLLFYHPVVALVSRRIRVERENACDDLAVSSTGNRLAYVEMLAALEHLRQPGPRLALGMQDGQIVGRIRRLVERARPRRQLGVTLPALLGLLLTASAVGVQMMPAPEGELTAPEAAIEPVTSGEQPTIEAVALEQPASQTAIEPIIETAPQSIVTEASAEAVLPEPEQSSQISATESTSRTPDDSVSVVPVIDSVQETPTRPSESLIETPDEDRPAPTAVDPAPLAQTASNDPADEAVETPSTPSSLMLDSEPALEVALRPEVPPAIDTSEPLPPVDLEPPVLTGGELLRRVEPNFPRNAKRRGINGLVEVEFTVDQRGQVQRINVIQERPVGWDFGESAQEAIAQWRFEPHRLGDEAVEQQLRVEIDFDLADVCGIRTGSRLPRC